LDRKSCASGAPPPREKERVAPPELAEESESSRSFSPENPEEGPSGSAAPILMTNEEEDSSSSSSSLLLSPEVPGNPAVIVQHHKSLQLLALEKNCMPSSAEQATEEEVLESGSTSFSSYYVQNSLQDMMKNNKPEDDNNKQNNAGGDDDDDDHESTGIMSETDEHDEDDHSHHESNEKDKERPPATAAATVTTPSSHLLSLWHDVRKGCGVVNDARVQLVIIVLILINALLMGVGTLDAVTESENVTRAFEYTDKAFLAVFTVEIAMQVVHWGLWTVVTDGWMCFDLIIVLASWSMESLQIVRAFRVFRAIRLITRLQALQMLVKALFDVAPAVAAICALLILIMYIFAVLCTELFGDMYEQGYLDLDYFGRLDKSLFTLFQMVTLDWASIARQVAAQKYYAWFIFTIFLVITSFILYSLVVAVVCDSVYVIERAEEEKREEHDAVEETKSAKVQVRQLQKRVAKLTKNQETLLLLLQDCVRQLEDTRSGGQHDDDERLSPASSAQSSPGKPSREHWTGSLVAAASLQPTSPDAPRARQALELDVTMRRKATKRQDQH